MKRRPRIAPVKISLPFLTCSGLLPPVMIVIVPIIMRMIAIPPAMPTMKRRRARVKLLVSKGMQPRAESMPFLQVPVGSIDGPELLVVLGALPVLVLPEGSVLVWQTLFSQVSVADTHSRGLGRLEAPRVQLLLDAL